MIMLKERLKKIKLFFNIEEELQTKTFQLEEIDQKITKNKNELKEIEDKINRKKSELQSLKTEVIELKDFINSKFKEEFKDCDYKVDIKHCYIISINDKKYISLRTHKTINSGMSMASDGIYLIEKYRYYDALSLDKNRKYKYLYDYCYGHFSRSTFCSKYSNRKPDYEVHILELYPELSTFTDDCIPNTYLKKIYYEINDLGAKSLINKNNIEEII